MDKGSRDQLRVRYDYRCGYCGVSETDAGALLTVDHYHPVAAGGSDDLDNGVYCCHACNEFKGDYWQPGSPERVLYPLDDDLAEHLREDDEGVLHGLTSSGVFHIEHLHLNRAQLVARRRERRQVEDLRRERRALARRLAELERTLDDLARQVALAAGPEQ